MSETVQFCQRCRTKTWHLNGVCEWSDGHRMTPDEKRRALAEQQTSDPQEIEALMKWMAENIDDDDLVVPPPRQRWEMKDDGKLFSEEPAADYSGSIKRFEE